MIIDSHSHAWSVWPYEPPVPDARSRGTVDQLLWEMDRNEVDRAVLVAARIDHNPGNNDYVAEAVRAHPDRLVQFADVDCKWTADYHRPGAVDRLREAADRYPIAGITHYLDGTNDGWLVSDEGMAFFALLAERGLVASIAGSPIWQEDLRTVARAFPDLVILCHHLAGVPSYRGDKEVALAAVLASAEVPNICVKVSGFYYGEARPWDFPAYAAIDWFRQIYEAFGARRLCWGSDYPVAPLRAHTYRQSLEIFRSHCGFVSPEDRDWILGQSLDAILAKRGA